MVWGCIWGFMGGLGADVGRSRVSVMNRGDRSLVEGLVMGVEKDSWFGLGFGLWFGARSRIPVVGWI